MVHKREKENTKAENFAVIKCQDLSDISQQKNARRHYLQIIYFSYSGNNTHRQQKKK
jgi:hypothetical protein